MPWLYASAHRKKGAKEPKLEDFLLHRVPKRKRRQMTDEQLAIVKMADALLGRKK